MDGKNGPCTPREKVIIVGAGPDPQALKALRGEECRMMVINLQAPPHRPSVADLRELLAIETGAYHIDLAAAARSEIPAPPPYVNFGSRRPVSSRALQMISVLVPGMMPSRPNFSRSTGRGRGRKRAR